MAAECVSSNLTTSPAAGRRAQQQQKDNMTKNIDLARECGAQCSRCADDGYRLTEFTDDQLAAFATRVLAENKASLQGRVVAEILIRPVTVFDFSRIAELEAQLEAVGAGGVSALIPARKPLSSLGRAGVAHEAFGNPIPQAAYKLIDLIEAAHNITGEKP